MHLFESFMDFYSSESPSEGGIHLFCDYRLDSINQDWGISRPIGAKDGLKIIQNDVLNSVNIILPLPRCIIDALNGVPIFSVWCFLMEEGSILVTISDPQISRALVPHCISASSHRFKVALTSWISVSLQIGWFLRTWSFWFSFAILFTTWPNSSLFQAVSWSWQVAWQLVIAAPSGL